MIDYIDMYFKTDVLTLLTTFLAFVNFDLRSDWKTFGIPNIETCGGKFQLKVKRPIGDLQINKQIWM